MPLFNHFDFLAPIYDTVIRSGPSPRLLKLLDLRPGNLVLDAAGGTGRIVRGIAPGVVQQAGQVVVLDLSIKMLRQALVKSDLVSVCASAEKLPYPDRLFDRILMVDALHHVARQAEVVRELVRVLKPGGRFVIEEPDIQTRAVKWIALGEKLAGMGSRFLTMEEGLALFRGLPGKINHHQEDHAAWWWFDKSQG
jgi:ubiquinone/menaquinone biosynthesis C-methylase UbiE